MYPQASISSTSSAENDVNEVIANNMDIKVKFVKEFYYLDAFVNYWSNLIAINIKKNYYTHPFLLFSAHSIPHYFADKGDTYPKAIEESALNIANITGLEFKCAYQSRMSGKWIGPDTKESLKLLAESGKGEIVIIPISFVNENLETLYDLDHDILPFAKNKLNIQNISRVKIPVADTQFINLLSEIVTLNN
jgi:ferrochelatase